LTKSDHPLNFDDCTLVPASPIPCVSCGAILG
jgi:hypothetical protein